MTDMATGIAAGREQDVAADWGGIARAFTQARAANVVLSDYPGAMPVTLADAYAIQDKAIAAAGAVIGGWKVGRIPDAEVARYGTNRLAGPVMADRIVEAAHGMPTMPLLAGFAAAEGEIMVRMDTVPDRWGSADDLSDHVAEIRLGIEIASSPFTGINDHGPAVTISDFGNNNGLVLGPVIADWTAIDWRRTPMRTMIGGQLAGEATLAQMLDGPFGAIAFLIGNLRERGRSLTSNDWVSTGAVTGVHRIEPGAHVEVTFGDWSVQCGTTA